MVGLDFAIAWDTNFIGKRNILAQREAGVSNRMVTLKLHDQDAMPLGNEPVLVDEKIVGKTTSAAFGYRIGAPIALAFINETSQCDVRNGVTVDIAGMLYKADLIDSPAFDSQGARMKLT